MTVRAMPRRPTRSTPEGAHFWRWVVANMRRNHIRTERALAEAIGTQPSTISGWKFNGSLPDHELRVALAKRFGVTIADVYRAAGQPVDEENEAAATLHRETDPAWFVEFIEELRAAGLSRPEARFVEAQVREFLRFREESAPYEADEPSTAPPPADEPSPPNGPQEPQRE